jgi:MFS family permease
MPLRIDLRQFDASFWRYLASFSIFSVSVFIFTELYPLYLQDLGVSVVVIGNASLALNLGCIAGTIPAVVLLRTPGMKGATLLSLAGASLATAARLWHTSALMVYGGAFAAGFFLAVLTVGIPVIVSRLTVPSNRALGFSCFFVTTITSGFLGDVVGGELPRWIGGVFGVERPGEQLAVATFLACVIGLVSVIPAARMRLSEEGHRQELRFPTGHATVRLMIAIAFWSFAVGLFAPFYSLYFSVHLDEPVNTIGLDLAGGQVMGAVFTIFAPMFIAGWGLVRGVRFMMFAAGACSFFLSAVSSTLPVGLGYALYMGFVAMVQIPVNTLLMNQVREEEHAGASMINSLVAFSAIAAGGFVGGRLIAVLGYPSMLALAGACCMLAAIVFVVMVKAGTVAGEDPIPA